MSKDQAIKQFLSPGFRYYLAKKLPAAWIAGVRIRELDTTRCVTSVPFKWLNQNPFKSIYFAIQAMAAELSTAASCLVAVSNEKPSIAFIIVNVKAEFSKKATSRVFFTCETGNKALEAVESCKATGEASIVTLRTVGRTADGTEVSQFEFTWSFKQRSS